MRIDVKWLSLACRNAMRNRRRSLVTLAIAATYADFRYPHIDWRAMAPKTAALQAELEKRQSFIDTYPK